MVMLVGSRSRDYEGIGEANQHKKQISIRSMTDTIWIFDVEKMCAVCRKFFSEELTHVCNLGIHKSNYTAYSNRVDDFI